MKYIILDSYGKFLGSFPTWKAAYEFKIINNRYDWKIIALTLKKLNL